MMPDLNTIQYPDGFSLRWARSDDVPVILRFIRELASYEKMLDDVETTEEILRDSLFVKGAAKALIAEYEGKPVGYAIFFYNFSTFTGRPGVYLEDLYIMPQMRGRGYGKSILRFLSDHARQSGCTRVEWTCLNWNEPSKRFYQGLGAVPKDEWIIFRLSGKSIEELAVSE